MGKTRKVYRVKVEEKAADFIRRQTKKVQRQIMNKIASLGEDPCGKGGKIQSTKEVFKIKSGCYRIAYVIKESQVLVLVVRVGHRKDFYVYFER